MAGPPNAGRPLSRTFSINIKSPACISEACARCARQRGRDKCGACLQWRPTDGARQGRNKPGDGWSVWIKILAIKSRKSSVLIHTTPKKGEGGGREKKNRNKVKAGIKEIRRGCILIILFSVAAVWLQSITRCAPSFFPD